jgi:hypothetical protein
MKKRMVTALKDENSIVNKAKGVMFNFNVRLSANARLLYVALLVAEEGQVLTHTDLMEVTGIKSAPTIIKTVKELQDNGFIAVTRLSKGQIYKVL